MGNKSDHLRDSAEETVAGPTSSHCTQKSRTKLKQPQTSLSDNTICISSDDSTADPHAGVSSRFRIHKLKLGEGAFASVRQGLDNITGERIAVKIVDVLNHSMPTWKVLREMQVMERLDHPNVVRLYEWFQRKDFIYMFLEYIDGIDLLSYVSRKKRLSESRACEIFTQILDGIEHCHQQGVAHRDLKLENIMLDRRSKSVKIIDFGLADSFPRESAERFSEYCGSPAYCCPQIAAGEPYNGRKADIWSLGVILYIMLVGAYPFWHSRKDVLLAQIKTKHIVYDPRLLGLSPSARDLIVRMLEKSEDTRISLDEIRRHPWLTSAPTQR